MSRDTAIRDAVVASLNAGSFSKPFKARAVYDPRLDLKDFDELRVSVAIREDALTTINAERKGSQHDIGIDVAVQQKMPGGDDLEFADAMRDLVEGLADHLIRSRLANATCFGIEHRTGWDPTHFREHRMFTAVFTANFRMFS